MPKKRVGFSRPTDAGHEGADGLIQGFRQSTDIFVVSGEKDMQRGVEKTHGDRVCTYRPKDFLVVVYLHRKQALNNRTARILVGCQNHFLYGQGAFVGSE